MWPPNSPDLNPVDYAVWNVLQQLTYQCLRFTTVNQLKQVFVTKCGKLPQRLVNCAIDQWRQNLGCVVQQKSADALNI